MIRLQNIDEPAPWWGTATITAPAGAEPVTIAVQWRYKDRAAAQDWWQRLCAGANPSRLLLEVMADWRDVDEPLSEQGLSALANWSIPALKDLATAYLSALSESRVKN